VANISSAKGDLLAEEQDPLVWTGLVVLLRTEQSGFESEEGVEASYVR
jgi:hypothetical protein